MVTGVCQFVLYMIIILKSKIRWWSLFQSCMVRGKHECLYACVCDVLLVVYLAALVFTMFVCVCVCVCRTPWSSIQVYPCLSFFFFFLGIC